MEAFESNDRENAGDMRASRDFEDVVALLDGRATLVQDVKQDPAEIQGFLEEAFSRFVHNPRIEDCIEAQMGFDKLARHEFRSCLSE